MDHPSTLYQRPFMSDSRGDEIGRLIDWLETRALPVLERIAVALERTPLVVPPLNSNGPGRGLAEVRQAIEAGQWSLADSIVRELELDHPGDPRISALADELLRSRQFAVDDLRQRIEAARQANDPEGAINSRDELGQILHGEPLLEVDRSLVKWLMVLIQKRLRTGTVRPDVVALAGRISESFGGTTEGASLRASLPTLRRAAGLCPKCSEPYKGVGDACPKCLAASSAPTPLSFEPIEEDEPEEPELEVSDGPIDLNNERFWQTP
jgi:hypothetical protein